MISVRLSAGIKWSFALTASSEFASSCWEEDSEGVTGEVLGKEEGGGQERCRSRR